MLAQFADTTGWLVAGLLYPAAALSITVLSFIMLGDALRDALDPKSRQR